MISGHDCDSPILWKIISLHVELLGCSEKQPKHQPVIVTWVWPPFPLSWSTNSMKRKPSTRATPMYVCSSVPPSPWLWSWSCWPGIGVSALLTASEWWCCECSVNVSTFHEKCMPILYIVRYLFKLISARNWHFCQLQNLNGETS